jgi:uncharacterized protein YbjT (DUF2867 family)
MSEKKVIAVVGATGAQGGSLVRAILEDKSGDFKARAISRDVNSDKAKALEESGAEVVSADVDDLQSLVTAFEGAYGAFCVTFFWEHFSPDKEKQHAKNMAEAAKECRVKHVIWSSLEDTRRWVPLNDDRMPTLMEKYKVPHFDAKGESNAYFTEKNLPVTILNTSFYWENLIYFGMGPQKGPDGKLAITFPMGDKRLPGISAEDIGKCAYGIFKNSDEYIGKTIGISGEFVSGSQMAETLSKAMGKEIAYNDVPADVYRSFGFPGAEDVGNMFQFKRDFDAEYISQRDIEQARILNPDLQNFETWVDRNKEKIPLD